MTERDAEAYTNWVDPDILAYDEGSAVNYDLDQERRFKEFFEIGWLDPKYDHLRERWDKLLQDESPHARVLAKTALWSLAQYLELNRMTPS
jgi:hypothetical protein